MFPLKTSRLGFPPSCPLLSGGLYCGGLLGWGLGTHWETFSGTYFCGLFLLIDYLGKMFLRFKPILPSSLVSDSRSLLEAFWILSLISLGRLETLHFPLSIMRVNVSKSVYMIYYSFCKHTPEFQWCRPYGCLNVSFSLGFFLFPQLPFSYSRCVMILASPSSLSESPLVGHHSSDAAR